jgi:hypothetical protein
MFAMYSPIAPQKNEPTVSVDWLLVRMALGHPQGDGTEGAGGVRTLR